MTSLSRRRFLLATGYVMAGVLALAALIVFDGRFPSFWRWLSFAVAFVVLEYNSVEVNDRMFQSSSVMVVLTAGIVFALDGSSAALGLATSRRWVRLCPRTCATSLVPADGQHGTVDRLGRCSRVGARHHVADVGFASPERLGPDPGRRERGLGGLHPHQLAAGLASR